MQFNIECEHPCITDQLRNSLEQPITLDEMSTVLNQMKRFKCPSGDGLPADWYKVFYCKIKHILLEAFNWAFKVNRLHISARRGIITLIPKVGRDTKWLKNWRPIILLGTEYKILAKIIANRMKQGLDMIIHENQTGFMAGRKITENLRVITDTVNYAKRKQLDALLISIDFEKAFDRVEYSSLYKVLRWFNFGEQFIKWVKLLFTDMELCTVNNGYSSEYFTPTRGLFRGNPISSYCFLQIIETFTLRIRANTKN